MSEPGPRRATFTPWFWSYRLAARLEAAVVICVFAGVLVIMGILFQQPGPLVVHLSDEVHTPVKNARVRCTSPDGATSFAGMTDVFGEAKWPGLQKGPWKCEVTPPALFHAGSQIGLATVVSRRPAVWNTQIERPARISVEVARPAGAPRAAVAVRAVCGSETWESRAGLLDGRTTLYVPHGQSCRVGLVRAEIGGNGPVTSTQLECDHEPCQEGLNGGIDQELKVSFTPTREQWEAIRPPAEPDAPEEPKKP